MALLWSTPRTWVTKDAITKERLNAISDNLKYLYNPTRQQIKVTGNGTNQTTTSTTFGDLDAINYTTTIELSGGSPVRVNLLGAVSNSAAGNQICVDILLNGTTYLSSLTATPVTLGLWAATAPVANYLIPVSFSVLIPPGTLAAGVHIIKPRWRTSAGTATWYENTVYSHIEVSEF